MERLSHQRSIATPNKSTNDKEVIIKGIVSRYDSTINQFRDYRKTSLNLGKYTKNFNAAPQERMQSKTIKNAENNGSCWYDTLKIALVTILLGQLFFSSGENSKRSFFAVNWMRNVQMF
ncbi:uncharacterized protein LOC123682782 [Harmonia axyridis]|uniref:uncharacterized protein LOC123682782 n=1 Tax=Harmonia axyridis TaxID=115357 RepID=UPI001E2766D4|nr:uncharacterized protein LOC123682782 [Harmonia axyridis]